MTRTAVKSSNLKSIGYDPAKKLLEVEFGSGGVFQYSGVTAQQHAALMRAKSIGSHFHAHIRSRHKSREAA